MTRKYILAMAVLAGASLAQPPNLPADPRERAAFVHTFVKQRLAVWQQRLELTDWNIAIRMSHRREMKAGTLGAIHWDKHRRKAEIQVMDTSDYELPFRDMLEDMEFTVVHELVHLELASLPRSRASRSEEEHAVNQMARALLQLDRGR